MSLRRDSLYSRAARCESVERPPIWMMRQAGRYLPEYRELRSKYSFIEMMGSPELATEVTMQPIRRFGMDAAIMFSDILVTAQALGFELDYVEGKGPLFADPYRDVSQLADVTDDLVAERLGHVGVEIGMLIDQLAETETPLIGFAGAPFTVASYMIEGGSSKDLAKTKLMMRSQPDLFTRLMESLVDLTVKYLNMQISAGVDGVQIFDTWSNYLTGDEYDIASFRPIQRIIARLENPDSVPVTVFCKHTLSVVDRLVDTGATVISCDMDSSISELCKKVPSDIAIQGNLDPAVLLGPIDELESATRALLACMADRPGYIFNLGHGITPKVDPGHVGRVVEIVKASAL